MASSSLARRLAGDISEGVFAALGAPQLAVVTTVVLIAAGLLAWSRRLAGSGDLL